MQLTVNNAAAYAYTGGKPIREGRVKLEIAELIDNGNAVPIVVRVDSPMTAADHVTAIAVFNEKNPQRDVVRMQLGPRAGKAQVATRIRLATSQKLVAVATMSNGTCWTHTVDVIVTPVVLKGGCSAAPGSAGAASGAALGALALLLAAGLRRRRLS